MISHYSHHNLQKVNDCELMRFASKKKTPRLKFEPKRNVLLVMHDLVTRCFGEHTLICACRFPGEDEEVENLTMVSMHALQLRDRLRPLKKKGVAARAPEDAMVAQER